MKGESAKVKAYLSRLRALEAVIAARKRLLDKLRKERTYLTGIQYDKDRVQSSSNGDVMKASDRLIDLERDIAKKVERAVRLREQIITEIWRVENPQYITLLLRRYVDGMRFEEIACDMGYSYTRITHIHGEALQAFAKVSKF